MYKSTPISNVQNIKNPVLVVIGGKDSICDPRQGKYFY